MSTFMANAQNIERKWYVIDAAGKPLGRTAVKAANILRGKHRPEFTPHADCGEFVIIVNADKAILTGKKLEQKYYRHHSGYIGGLKEIQYKTLMATHAIMDALLGAAALGDIGRHFPDSDEAYRGADSLKLASHVADLLKRHGYAIVNVDATLIAQRPKIAPYIEQMKQNLACTLGITAEQINVKATTEEHLGFTGEGLGMAAHAVCLIERI